MYWMHVLMAALLPFTTVGMSSQCIHEEQERVEKQPLGGTLMIVLKPQATPLGTVSSLLGTETSAGHIHTDWGFVLCFRNKTRIQWACVYLHFSRPPFQGNTPPCMWAGLSVEMDQSGVAGCSPSMAFSALEKVIISIHFTGNLGWQNNLTANLTEASAAPVHTPENNSFSKHLGDDFPVWSKQKTGGTVYSTGRVKPAENLFQALACSNRLNW